MKNAVRLGCCLFFLLLTTGLAAAQPPAGLATEDARLWQLAEKEQSAYEETVVLVHDKNLVSYVNGVIERLWSVSGAELPPMTVRVVENEAPDAFAYPNGVCYVSSGMLAVIANEHQLAMVLGHELAHYVCRHTHTALGRLQMSFGPSPRPESSLTGRKIWTSFLAEAEQQADRLGLEYAARAGFCPGQALALLTVLDGATIAPGEQHSHLPYKQRFSYIEKWLAENGGSFACGQAAADNKGFVRSTAAARLATARAACRKGDWQPALRNISAYLELRPNDPEAHFLNGEILRRSAGQDALSSASRAYLEAIRLDKDFAPAYRAMGMLHYKSGKKRLAGDYFSSYLALAPDSVDNSYVSAYLKQCRQ